MEERATVEVGDIVYHTKLTIEEFSKVEKYKTRYRVVQIVDNKAELEWEKRIYSKFWVSLNNLYLVKKSPRKTSLE